MNVTLKSNAERGDASRLKLIEAATKIFGQYGFEGASTRQLAKEAGVNIAAIPYYFGGKEGLYMAVIDNIVDYFTTGMGGLLGDIKGELNAGAVTDVRAREMLHTLVSEMTKFLLGGSKDRIHASRIITREQLDPTPAFDRLYEKLICEMHTTLGLLVSRLIGIAPHDPTLKLRTQALIGQIVAFKSSRETVLRNMGWKEFGPEEIETVIDVLQFHVDAVIEAYQSKKS